jgi:threonine synthase
MTIMNSRVASMYCLKCNSDLAIGDYFFGCPHCLAKGENASVSLRYAGKAAVNGAQKGLLRYSEFLPYEQFPTLGEGDTPLVSVPRLAAELGLQNVGIKNEFQNPTGSHKDRMNPFIVARALQTGRTTVAAASSGNEGVSLAVYAAAAGLACKIVSTPAVTPIWKASILAAGADLVIMETPQARWDYLRAKVKTEGWYPATNMIAPPVGSSCYGIQGYKTISYEIYEECKDNLPDFIFVPVARGDLLWGIYEGFADLRKLGNIAKLPRLVAVEPLPRLEKVLAGEDYRTHYEGDTPLTASIGGGTVTYQSKLALEKTDGFAVSIPQDEAVQNVRRLAKYGFYLELSSALILGGLIKSVKEKKLAPEANVLLIATSHGFKNNPELFI